MKMTNNTDNLWTTAFKIPPKTTVTLTPMQMAAYQRDYETFLKAVEDGELTISNDL